jgi:hypothetical protein
MVDFFSPLPRASAPFAFRSGPTARPPHVLRVPPLLSAEKNWGEKLRPPHNCADQPLLPPPPQRRIAVVAVRVRRRCPGHRPGSPPSDRHRRPGSPLPSGIVVRAAIPGRLHPVTAAVRGCRRGCRGEHARANGSAAGTPQLDPLLRSTIQTYSCCDHRLDRVFCRALARWTGAGAGRCG